MKQFLLILFFSFALLGCGSGENEPAPPEKDPLSVNTFKLFINGEEFIPDEYTLNGHYLCDRCISFSVYAKKDKQLYSIDFDLTKDGSPIRFTISANNGTDYESPLYDQAKSMKVNDLQIDVQNHYIKTNFEGTLYDDPTNEPVNIRGEFEIKIFSPSSCNSYNEIVILNDNIKFDKVGTGMYPATGEVENIWYDADSYNGWHMEINGLKKTLHEMDLGTYKFGVSHEKEFISLKKYIGEPKIFSIVKPSDWQTYETSGSFTIESHEIIDNHKVTKGKINLNVYENGKLIQTINNGKFEIAD